ncbi:16S rRNA (cytosine(967)-C(5))-methyltransferase RsmB [Subdoligranulum variabile]|uniref:16S rRNA (cytosine(967)-C(5))-methyltransferase n=1 Tax=Subdoligranulum variabile DSM 15176 TaxID=411471 RepID=D1PM68_9FIRM|nr:16S rRNA (cytosine(967)-C(5))-methyltransferase RsmB [Subdoligranulum variabile]EFB75653.1 ribosomal RNA small subunit methyltransferase B [Subdoligranulum variabile DSM 15176]UWP68361.1 16S rRNA (cytosine(967)-C(5))-methyltransferase RsmB [Subdoligranulum variabile]
MTPRRLAVKALLHQEQAGYANLVLDAELKKCTPPLEGRDAAFAARIFYTVLEYQPLLDFLLDRFSKKPVARLDAPVRAILRAGLAQARFMEVPLPAAVNESVKLTKAMGKTSAAGMVNAVLRRAAVYPVKEKDFADPLERLQIYDCLSRPVAALLYQEYGEETFDLAAAFRNRPVSAVRVNTLRTTDEALIQALQAEGHTVRPGPWPHALLVEFQGSPAAGNSFAEGHYHVQGLASQFAALSLAVRPGQKVLDLCAAPGGKSLTLAEEMQNTGELISGEVLPGRVSLIQKAFERCGIRCARAVQNDATVPRKEWGTFDRVLCDVPCSGLGVIAKKPDIRYKDLDGMENLCAIQQKILQNGADSLAENGRLVYSTCTINVQENQKQVENFLCDHPEFRVVAPELTLPGMEQGPFGTLFLPHKTGTDGFFVAILEKLST